MHDVFEIDKFCWCLNAGANFTLNLIEPADQLVIDFGVAAHVAVS